MLDQCKGSGAKKQTRLDCVTSFQNKHTIVSFTSISESKYDLGVSLNCEQVAELELFPHSVFVKKIDPFMAVVLVPIYHF